MFKKLKDWMFPTLPEPEVDMILEDRMWGNWTVIEIVRVSDCQKSVIYVFRRFNGRGCHTQYEKHQATWKDIYISYKIQDNKNV